MMKAWMEWLVSFISYLKRRMIDDRLSDIAATLTLTSLLAVVPLLAVVFSLLSSLPVGKDLGLGIQAFIFNNFVPDFSEEIQHTISDFVQRASEMKSLGFATLVLTAILLLRTIDNAFNQIWRIKNQRKTLVAFISYWLVLILGPLFLALSIGLSSYFSSLLMVTDTGRQIGALLTIVLPWLLTTIGLVLLYLIIPNTRIKLSHAMIGAVLAGLLFEIAKKLFTLYVTSFPLQEIIYGALSAVPLFIIWIYLSWMLILLGAEICHGLENYQAEDIQHTKDNYFLDCLRVLKIIDSYSDHEKCPTRADVLDEIGLISDYAISESLQELLTLELIDIMDDGRYCLLKDLEKISLIEFIQSVKWKLPTRNAISHSEFIHTRLGREVLSILDNLEQRTICSLRQSYHQV